jgi:hypothetical protein
MLLEVRGWRWIRRFRLVAATDAPGPEVREEPGYQPAIGAQFRDHGAWGARRGARARENLRHVEGVVAVALTSAHAPAGYLKRRTTRTAPSLRGWHCGQYLGANDRPMPPVQASL